MLMDTESNGIARGWGSINCKGLTEGIYLVDTRGFGYGDSSGSGSTLFKFFANGWACGFAEDGKEIEDILED